MAYNIHLIPQIEVSGSLTPEKPYFITQGTINDKVVEYFYTEEEAQNYINGL